MNEFPEGKENYCPRCYFAVGRTVLRTECPHSVPDPDPIVRDWEKEFLRIHYEPEHTSGGMCWCGITYIKRDDGKMEIVHKEQRVILKSFISSLLTAAKAEGYEKGKEQVLKLARRAKRGIPIEDHPVSRFAHTVMDELLEAARSLTDGV